MAVRNNDDSLKTYSVASNADYSANQYKVLKFSALRTVTLATLATEKIIGVLQNAPKAKDKAVVLLRNSDSTGKILLGGTVALDDYLTTNASGLAITTVTAGDEIIGRALEPGVTGQVIEYMPQDRKV